MRLLKSSTDRDLHATPNRIITLMRKACQCFKRQDQHRHSFFGGAALGRGCYTGFSLAVVRKLLWLWWLLLLKRMGSRHAGSIAAAPRLSSPLACGIFLFRSAQLCQTLCDQMGLLHARLPGSSPTPGVYSNSFMSIESVMPSNHLILCHPLLPPSIFPSIRVISSESVLLIRWPKYWSFSVTISPSNEYSGLFL